VEHAKNQGRIAFGIVDDEVGKARQGDEPVSLVGEVRPQAADLAMRAAALGGRCDRVAQRLRRRPSPYRPSFPLTS